MTNSQKELSTSQAAELVGMSHSSLLRFISKGELESHRVGSQQGVFLQDLLEFQERRTEAMKAYQEAVSVATPEADLRLSNGELEELRLSLKE